MKCDECGGDLGQRYGDWWGVTIVFTCDECGERWKVETFNWPDPSDELPPGVMGIVNTVGGGTEVVTGNMRGNTQLHGGHDRILQLNAVIRREKLKNARMR